MKISKTKSIALATLVGGTVLGAGCLGSLPWQKLLWSAAVNTGLEFVLDNDAVIDLFPDGNADAG